MIQLKEEATVKRERAMAYAFFHQANGLRLIYCNIPSCDMWKGRIDLATYVTKVDLPFPEHILKELQS